MKSLIPVALCFFILTGCQTTDLGKAPNNWGVKPGEIKTRRGKIKPQGLVFTDPDDKYRSLRFMPGDPDSKFPHQRQPYVVAQKGNRVFDKNGNVLSTNRAPEAHIPLDEFDFNRVWGNK